MMQNLPNAKMTQFEIIYNYSITIPEVLFNTEKNFFKFWSSVDSASVLYVSLSL